MRHDNARIQFRDRAATTQSVAAPAIKNVNEPR
jgi:hypothetical protein